MLTEESKNLLDQVKTQLGAFRLNDGNLTLDLRPRHDADRGLRLYVAESGTEHYLPESIKDPAILAVLVKQFWFAYSSGKHAGIKEKEAQLRDLLGLHTHENGNVYVLE